jgi:PilZ domain
MISNNLQGIAEVVVRRAQRQGYVISRDVREELANANLPETLWKDVVALGRASLSYRQGRYYYTTPVSDRVRKEQTQQRDIQKVVRQLIKQHRAAAREVERREEDRFDFIQPVKVTTEDNREFTVLSRDISPTGIRLITTRRFLGQKIRVRIPRTDSATPSAFVVRVLWTCAISDDLFENGGTFIELAESGIRSHTEE